MKVMSGAQTRQMYIVLMLLSTWLVMGRVPAVIGAMMQTNANFSVVLVSTPPCVFNGGNSINVSFGDEVLTSRVDGVNYRQPVPYNLTCSPAPSRNAMKLQFHGMAAGFDSALSTSNPNLGIKLISGTTALPPTSWLNFSWPTMPTIDAVLVKRPGAMLLAGPFTGVATLLVEYQ